MRQADVTAGDLDESRARDVLGEGATQLDGDERALPHVQHEGGCLHERKGWTHVQVSQEVAVPRRSKRMERFFVAILLQKSASWSRSQK